MPLFRHSTLQLVKPFLKPNLQTQFWKPFRYPVQSENPKCDFSSQISKLISFYPFSNGFLQGKLKTIIFRSTNGKKCFNFGRSLTWIIPWNGSSDYSHSIFFLPKKLFLAIFPNWKLLFPTRKVFSAIFPRQKLFFGALKLFSTIFSSLVMFFQAKNHSLRRDFLRQNLFFSAIIICCDKKVKNEKLAPSNCGHTVVILESPRNTFMANFSFLWRFWYRRKKKTVFLIVYVMLSVIINTYICY